MKAPSLDLDLDLDLDLGLGLGLGWGRPGRDPESSTAPPWLPRNPGCPGPWSGRAGNHLHPTATGWDEPEIPTQLLVMGSRED